MKRQRLRLLLDAIAEHSDELAQVVMLRDLDGLDYKDIAAFLSLPDGTVKSHLNQDASSWPTSSRPRGRPPHGNALLDGFPLLADGGGR